MRENLLVMAAYLRGAQPGREIRANCWRVLRQALQWAGLWTDQMEQDKCCDIKNPVIGDWYNTLITMIRREPESERLIEGAGNFGPPASPPFTGCRLTEKGRLSAEILFGKYPEYRP